MEVFGIRWHNSRGFRRKLSTMQLDLWQLILLATLGVVAGILNVIAGGGSLLTLPTMIFMGIPEAVANGTNRVAILAQNVTAVSGFRAKGFSDFKLSFTLALVSIPGALLGAHMGALIRGALFNRILAVVMLAVIVWMTVKERRKPIAADIARGEAKSEPLSGTRLLWGHVAMIGVGFYGGFIQAGVGFLLMAVLHNVMRLDLVRVNMHKVFIVGAFTSAALSVFLAHGKIWWIPGLCLAVGNALGGWIGSQLSIAKGETLIRKVLYVALAAMAIKLMLG